MKKKQFIAIGVGAIVVLFVGWSLLRGGGPSPVGSGNDVPGRASEIGLEDDEMKALVKDVNERSAAYVEPAETALDKIESARESGSITVEQYALLSLRAIYGGEELPAEYQGAADISKDHAYLYALISSNWNSFSAEAKEKIQPFLLPPRDPKSYFYKKPGAGLDMPKEFSLLKTARAEGVIVDIDPTEYKLEPLPRIVIGYVKPEEENQANWTAQAMRDSVPRFTGLLNIPHKSVVIVFVGAELKADGQAGLDTEDQATCHIKIRANQNEKGIKTTAAHELFHCYQFWYGLVYEKPDTQWLMESTATWAEHFVYPEYNSEHAYDGDLFPRMNMDLLSRAGNREYGTYLWHYFTTQRSGSQEVVAALNSGKFNGARETMVRRDNFGREYRDFALWNWNRDPFKRYIDAPAFPGVSPYWKSVDTKEIQNVGESEHELKLEKGGMLYRFITISNEDIKYVEFYPSRFTGASESDATRGLQAVYKVNGQWHYEDWTGMEKRSFCRDLDGEKLELLVLIASNADLKAPTAGVLPYKTTKTCGPGWKGTISVKWQRQNAMEAGGSKAIYAEAGEYQLSETLQYNVEDDELVVENQQYMARYDDEQKVWNDTKECGQMWNNYSHHRNGSGFIDYKKAGDMPARAQGENENEMGRLGGPYELSFRIFGDPKGDKFVGFDLRTQYNKPCTMGMIPEASGIKTEPYRYTSDEFGYEPNDKVVTIDANARSFSGEDKFEISSGVFGTVRWSYQRLD